MGRQGLGIHAVLLNNSIFHDSPLLLLSRAPLPWESFFQMRQYHIVRLVCMGEDRPDGASADMNGMNESERTSFRTGGADREAQIRGQQPPCSQARTAKGHRRATLFPDDG